MLASSTRPECVGIHVEDSHRREEGRVGSSGICVEALEGLVGQVLRVLVCHRLDHSRLASKHRHRVASEVIAVGARVGVGPLVRQNEVKNAPLAIVVLAAAGNPVASNNGASGREGHQENVRNLDLVRDDVVRVDGGDGAFQVRGGHDGDGVRDRDGHGLAAAHLGPLLGHELELRVDGVGLARQARAISKEGGGAHAVAADASALGAVRTGYLAVNRVSVGPLNVSSDKANSVDVGGSLLDRVLLVAHHGRHASVDANVGLALDVAQRVRVQGAREGALNADHSGVARHLVLAAHGAERRGLVQGVDPRVGSDLSLMVVGQRQGGAVC
mmetsp:Transcript_37074/g.93151  ORF Transcript_37074/g.93151 Transcript_37074/m.93151 type:complete len:329 (-) Transcript_37074:1071-2057(-)